MTPSHHPEQDRHQLSLYRLAAIGQYLYDAFGNDSNRGGLPLLSLERVRAAQAEIDEAIKQGQRARRRCLGGEINLTEQPGHLAPSDLVLPEKPILPIPARRRWWKFWPPSEDTP